MGKSKEKINPWDLLWDLWCIVSIVGIWPRYIEPNLLQISKINLQIPSLPPSLQGLKIVQFSDLHLNSKVPNTFLRKLEREINKLQPDILVFTGDFLCFSKIKNKERLKNFLCKLTAPYGCYAILGNHDYAQFVSINENGDYDLLETQGSILSKGFKRLFSSISLSKKTTSRAQAIEKNSELIDLLKQTPFELLDNKTKKIRVKDAILNLCGLEEYVLGRCRPEEAFKEYDRHYPGIVLAHNPDSLPLLMDYPGELILSGHTHGGQINLPWMRKKFTLMENPDFIRGLKKVGDKKIYINRGVGGIPRFRWFARPELLLVTWEKE